LAAGGARKNKTLAVENQNSHSSRAPPDDEINPLDGTFLHFTPRLRTHSHFFYTCYIQHGVKCLPWEQKMAFSSKTRSAFLLFTLITGIDLRFFSAMRRKSVVLFSLNATRLGVASSIIFLFISLFLTALTRVDTFEFYFKFRCQIEPVFYNMYTYYKIL